MKKKILFSVDNLQVGGVQHVTLDAANLLQNAGYETHVLNYDCKNNFYHTSVPLVQQPMTPLKISGKILRKLLHLIFPKYVKDNVEYFFYKELKRNHYDIVILNPPFFLYLNHLKAIFPATRFYMWMHNNFDIYQNDVSYFGNRFDELIKNVSSADGIICLEPYTASKWRKYNDNVTVIHNPATIANANKIANLDLKIICFTGRLSLRQKGLDYLVDIAAALPETWKISIAGSGPDEKRFLDLIAEKGLENKFIMCGPLTGENLINHYLNSSIFILPSRWEGMPLVSIEAMSVGLPVISFDIPAMQEVTAHGMYGLMAKGDDVQDFRNKLCQLIHSRDLREQYSALSLERVKMFSPEVIAKDWENLINN
ncbi:glycosyltransferase [Bifidobacterium avesanii]|uniref:Glycosyltransferase n=1 Tax=Bifidobacterium avesanii TaxID=1798157 RepID=A0A7K3TJX7_9BIFI|nr:glycosyltransferase [Bifidobacterium avesanii]KAB8290088.1 Glycosyl transferase group 1 [Bifidobacterium avesanii]NEG78964.1 glycosyltransferase [Bifidobacterium avesanii]